VNFLPRRVITERQAKAFGPGAEPDDYPTRLLKYVPAETNTLYVGAIGFITTAQTTLPEDANIPFSTIIWAVFIGSFIFNIAYMYLVAKETNPIRLGISTGAFVVWAIAMGNIFAGVNWWYSFYGSIILIFYTAIAGLYQGK
jgi:hypothetical protein